MTTRLLLLPDSWGCLPLLLIIIDPSLSVLHTPVLSETQYFDEYSTSRARGDAVRNGDGDFPVYSENSNNESVSAPLVSGDVEAEYSTILMAIKNEHCAPKKHSHYRSVNIRGLRWVIKWN